MTSEDVLKIVVQTEGAAEVHKLSEAFLGNVEQITQLRAKLATLDEAHTKGKMLADQYAAEQAIVTAELTKQAAQAAATGAAITNLGGKIPSATGGMRNMGYAAQQVNFAMQDLMQGGVASIINNIPGIVQSFGGSMGLAAALGGVGLAFVVLKPLVLKAVEYFGDGAVSADTFAEKVKLLEKDIKTLTEKKNKVSVDYADLEDAEQRFKRLTDAQRAYDELDKAKSTAQEAAAKAFKEAVTEYAGGDEKRSGAQRLTEAIVAAEKGPGGFAPQDQAAEAAIREKSAKAKEFEAFGDQVRAMQLREEVAALYRKSGEAARKRAGGMAATPTEANRARIAALLAAKPEAFAGQGIDTELFGSALAEAAPGAIAAKEAEEYAEKVAKEGVQDRREFRSAVKAAEAKKATAAAAAAADVKARFRKALAQVNQEAEAGADQLDYEAKLKADAAKKAGAARTKAIGHAAGAFDDALKGPAMYDLAGGGAEAGVRAALEGRLRATGRVAEGIVAEVAAKILADAKDQLAEKLLAAAAGGAANPAAAVRFDLGQGARKAGEAAALPELAGQLQARTGADPEQAMQMARRTLELMQNGGMPMMRAAGQAVAEMNAKVQQVWGEMDHMQTQFQGAAQGMRRMRPRNG